MNLLFWGVTLGFLGKITLAVAVLRVHLHILREHRIDNVVLIAIKRERLVTLAAIALIVVGYVLEILFFTQHDLFQCTPQECGTSLFNAL